MVPRRTRRALLRAGAPAVAAAVAGCYFGPTDPRNGSSGSDGGDGPAGDGSSDDGTPSDGTSDGGGGSDGTPSQTAGRTFSFQLTNSVTAEELNEVSGLSADTPATVVLDVEIHYDDREETAFEKTFELLPGETRTVDDVFTTEDGPQYVIRSVLEGAYAEYSSRSANRSEGYRFTGGGFGGPSGTRFEISLVSAKFSEDFVPVLTMDVPK